MNTTGEPSNQSIGREYPRNLQNEMIPDSEGNNENVEQNECISDVRQGLNLNLEYVQVNRSCGLCDTETAEGRCLDCDEDLCAVCVKYHEKLKITAMHNILFFDSPGNLRKIKNGPETVKTRHNCQKHEEEMLRFFCKMCRVPVCRDCILTSHKDHVTSDILDEAHGAKGQVQNLLIKVEKSKNSIEKQYEKLKDYENEFLENIESIGHIVSRLYKDISERIEESHRTLLKTLESTKKDEVGRIQHRQKFCNQKLISIADFLSKGEQLLFSESDSEIVLQMDILRQAAPALCDVRDISPTKAEFILSRNANFAKNTADNVIGHVSFTVTDSKGDSEQKCTHVREVRLTRDIAFHIWEMKCTKPSVRGICESVNGVIWVATPKSLLKLGTDGRRQNSIHLTSDVSCIIEGNDGKLLVAFNRGSGIKALSHDSVSTWSHYATLPDTVVSMSATDDKQRVFATVATSRDLIVFCNQGKDMVRVKLPEELTQNNSVITSMAIGKNGEAVVCSSNGRLVILSDSFDVRYVYKGPSGVMFPSSVCYDNQGHVIIADGKRQTVHMISRTGHFLAFLLSKDDFQDIGAPTCVCVDQSERLWVGTDMGNVCAYTYIHDVQ